MVKIDDFKKLKQLDRIEYLLHLKRIEEKNDNHFFSSFLHIFFLILGFLLLVFLGVSNLIGIDKAVPLLNSIIKITRIGVWVIFFALILDIIFWLRGKIWKKELREEYFKIETKPIK